MLRPPLLPLAYLDTTATSGLGVEDASFGLGPVDDLMLN